MKIKTIRKAITMKLTAWLSTINDEKLRADVRANILVSGGSITSMLLGEPVNDYDVYIKDMDVLIRLAKYYTPKVLDGRLKAQYLENHASDEVFSDEDGGENLAELAIRIKNLKPDQVKLDIPSEGIRIDLNPKELSSGLYKVAFLSQNAISLTDDLQIVLRFHGDNEQIHKTFDFMHATNYFTFEEGLVVNTDALSSIITKELRYQGSLYPLTSIIRMKKFILRGWSINAGEILKIMFQISELDLKDPVVLEEQLIGVDIAYFSQLIDILRGTPKGKITSAYLNTLIDKVFNEHEYDN
tara:strand:- start:34343 stop:35239 length:897 start_codon:yes stop_codon:yes gene_type:complete